MTQAWVASTGRSLQGNINIPGDKSISHRAVMLASLADGVSRIGGFLEGADTRATANIFSRMGVRIEEPADGVRIIHGVGMDGLRAPRVPLDCGNAGTAMRLLSGLLAGQGFDSVLVGDHSLTQRPMQRVTEPLAAMGAQIGSDRGHAPLHIHGGQPLLGIDYRLPVASAQVKSAVLLAGLRAQGETVVRESHPTRDYTERMLQAFGYPAEIAPGRVGLRGGGRLHATDVVVPADFSSAAFFIVAACVVPGSCLRLRQIGVDPRRTGLLRVLQLMGADITVTETEAANQIVGDIVVRAARLHGVEVPVACVADMIDEFPALFVAAACATGNTIIRGAAELRVKESDRLATMAAGLRALGIVVDESPDGAVIHGGTMHGGAIDSHGDHRIAMAFAVAGQIADGAVRIADVANVATSFPGFAALARATGFSLEPVA
ncbi:MAG: 3-phosphoshikimate 1-carboxyvinyltransferase [Luteimonas sp.]